MGGPKLPNVGFRPHKQLAHALKLRNETIQLLLANATGERKNILWTYLKPLLESTVDLVEKYLAQPQVREILEEIREMCRDTT